MKKLSFFVILSIITIIAFFKKENKTIIPNKSTIIVKEINNKPKEISQNIKKDKKIINKIAQELHQIFTQVLNKHNIKKESSFIIKLCQPIDPNHCKDICIDENKQAKVCEFEIIEKETYWACLVDDPNCENRIELIPEEVIVSNKMKILKNKLCLSENTNCKKGKNQFEVSEMQLETFLTPMSIKKYQQKESITKILNHLHKNRQELNIFSDCIANSVQDIYEFKEDEERTIELFQECAIN
jgi:hypothetical protein